MQKQLGQLALQNTQLVEKYDQARVTVLQRQAAAVLAEHGAARARADFTAAHTQFVQIIQAQYEGQSFGAAGALLDSKSGSNYLDRLDALEMITNHTADVVTEVTTLRSRAEAAAAAAAASVAQATAQRDLVNKQQTAVVKQIATYRTLLATLTSAQQAAYQRAATQAVTAMRVAQLRRSFASTATQNAPATVSHTTSQPTGNPASKPTSNPASHATSNPGHAPAKTTGTVTVTGAARRAVQFALDQVGKPYHWGSAGPGSFDCSGLTMMSWRAAGVSLPHSAAGQYGYGHHVSRDELQPGDLIFFYHPIGHVTIYIGDGLMVSAPTTGQNVSVVPLAAYDNVYAGATRLT